MSDVVYVTPTQDDELFTADDIIAADDIQFEDVRVPEWGGKKVRIRSLDGLGRAMINGTMFAVSGRDVKLKAKEIAESEITTLAACIVDRNMVPLFSGAHVRQLGRKNARVLGRLLAVAQRLSGMDDDAVETAAEN